MIQTHKRASATKRNLVVDVAVLAAFLIAGAPRLTGMTIHEWLGIAFGAAIVTHLLLHWQWIVAVTRRFFARMPGGTRLNYILNILLFIAITVVIFSGLLISESALPLFGIQLQAGGAWKLIHGLAADLSVLIVGLHVALHWRWIANALKTYVWRPVAARVAWRSPAGAPGGEVHS